MSWRETLESLADLPDEELHEALGRLEAVKAALLTRLAGNGRQDSRNRNLLTAEQAAERLGVDTRWIYRHQNELGGVKLSDRALRFSEKSVERYIERRRAL